MRQVKQGIKLAFLFVLILLPAAFMVYSGGYAMDTASVYTVERVNLESSDIAVTDADDLDLWERVGILNGVVTEMQTTEYGDLTPGHDLLARMEAELMAMHRYGALPTLSFSDAVSAYCTERLYLDPSDPTRSVWVWLIGAEYETFTVYVYMDMETSALYDVFLNVNTKDDFLYDTDLSEQGFFDYLDSFSEADRGEIPFSAACHYGADTIILSLISTNSPMEKSARYRIAW